MLENRKLPYKNKSLTALDKISGWELTEKKEAFHSTATPNVKVWYKDFEIPQLEAIRRIWVCLPSGYEESDKRYPVILPA